MAVNKYTTCDHTKRLIPDMTVDKDIAEAIGKEFRTLPLFEKGLFEHKYINYYSLQNNEYLKCRWREYIMKYESRIFAPFQFLDIRDLHFYNGNVRLYPSASYSYLKSAGFGQKMKQGPGVDFRGQRPIPNELIMKRSAKSPRPRPLLKRKGKNVEVQVGLKTDNGA